MQSKATSAKEYLAELPEDRRAALTKIRALVRKTAPAAKEGIQYGMIAYTIGELLCGLASQKQYMAVYCCSEVVDKHRSRLGKLNCGKGCIRFRKLEDLPLDAVSDILAETAQMLEAREAAKV